MDESCLYNRVAAWRRVLSPWIAKLWGRLTISLSDMPQRDDLERNLWIRFTSNDKSDNRDAWVQWLEGFELLDILASRDSRACWDIILALTNDKARLPSLGCSPDIFYGLRPRYETTFAFRTLFFPREDVAALLSVGIKDGEHTSEYAAAKAELLELAGPRSRAPIQLRWYFEITSHYVDSNRIERARHRGRLNHVLALATIASTTHKTPRTCFELASVGFTYAIHRSNEAREIVQRIASVVPISVLHMSEPLLADQFKTNFYGPYLWRMLAPQRSRRSHLGTQKIVITSTKLMRDANVSAVASAIAHSHTLRELSFSGWHCSWASWLAFALFSKTATHAIDTVSLELSHTVPKFVEALRQVVEHPNPVAYMAVVHDGDGVAKRLVNWSATTVRVNAQTPIHVRDHLRSAKTVYHGRQDAVCHVAANAQGEFVRVLIPGVGFGRIRRSDVLGTPEPTTIRETHAVRSLRLMAGTCDVEHFLAFLELVGAPLTTLTLKSDEHGYGKALRLTEILAQCPNLKHLILVGQEIYAETLLPSTSARHLESLKLIRCRVVTRNSGYKLCITPRMAPQLTSFFARYTGGVGMDLPAFAMALLATNRLERFVLGVCPYDIGKEEAYRQQAAHYHGQKFPAIALPVKLAILSVLALGQHYPLGNEIIARVFEMVASPVNRRCCAVVH